MDQAGVVEADDAHITADPQPGLGGRLGAADRRGVGGADEGGGPVIAGEAPGDVLGHGADLVTALDLDRLAAEGRHGRAVAGTTVVQGAVARRTRPGDASVASGPKVLHRVGNPPTAVDVHPVLGAGTVPVSPEADVGHPLAVEVVEPGVTGERARQDEPVDAAGAVHLVVRGQLVLDVDRADQHDVVLAGRGGTAQVVEEPVEQQVLLVLGQMAAVAEGPGGARAQGRAQPARPVPELVDRPLDAQPGGRQHSLRGVDHVGHRLAGHAGAVGDGGDGGRAIEPSRPARRRRRCCRRPHVSSDAPHRWFRCDARHSGFSVVR